MVGSLPLPRSKKSPKTPLQIKFLNSFVFFCRQSRVETFANLFLNPWTVRVSPCGSTGHYSPLLLLAFHPLQLLESPGRENPWGPNIQNTLQTPKAPPKRQGEGGVQDFPFWILGLHSCTWPGLCRVKLSHAKPRIPIPKGPWSLSSLSRIMQGKLSKLACLGCGPAVLWKHCTGPWQQQRQPHPPLLGDVSPDACTQDQPSAQATLF